MKKDSLFVGGFFILARVRAYYVAKFGYLTVSR
jgi:hypothetical protein